MLRWCERVHTWFPGAVGERRSPSEHRRCQSVPEEGLRLLIPGALPSMDPLFSEENIDPPVRGLHECALGADGIGSCTEDLCCESCVGGMAAEDVVQMEIRAAAAAEEGVDEESRRRARPGVKIKGGEEFPPPLRWLVGGGGDHGRWSRFMRAERRDGRLILTEGRIERPPRVFHARREDGRLRLDWIESEGEEPAAATTPEEEETQCGRRIGEGFGRCQEVAIGSGGGGGMLRGWNHRFVTMA